MHRLVRGLHRATRPRGGHADTSGNRRCHGDGTNRDDDSDEAREGRPEPSFSRSCLTELKHSAKSGSCITQSREPSGHGRAVERIERGQEGPTAMRTG